MRDPLANQSDDPYTLLGVSQDCTPDEAERAMDTYLGRTRGRENEALDACDTLRDPERRLAIDIFRYPKTNPAFDGPLPDDEELSRMLEIVEKAIESIDVELEWDRVMPILPVDEIS